MKLLKPWLAIVPRSLVVVFVLLAAGRCAAQGTAGPVDPVEELRLALPVQIGDERHEPALKFRKETLEKRAAALKTLGDMRQALALTEWKDMVTPGVAPTPIHIIDGAVRTSIGKRLIAAVKAVAAKGDATSRLAVAQFIAEMGTGLRGIEGETSGFARSLTPVLLQLVRDSDPGVRLAAVAGLAKINPDPAEVTPALKMVLEKDGVPLRRAAADSLLSLVRNAAQLQKKGKTQSGVEVSPSEVVAAATAVVPVAAPGVTDADVLVRRCLCQEAQLQSALGISDLVGGAFLPSDFPPPEIVWSDYQTSEYNKKAKRVHEDEKMLEPLTEAFRKESKSLAKTLTDPDVQVRILSRRTLEMVSNARLRLRKLAVSLPPPPMAKAAPLDSLKNDRLGEAVRPGLLVIAKRTGDPDVRVRRAAVDFLETLEDAAAPAVPRLALALNDSDRFVRWAAARALGRVGTVQTDLTVPLLAALVSDKDMDVSQAASYTLERYGTRARAAVPTLTRLLGTASDPEVVLGIINALASIGPQDADQIVMPLTKMMSNSDARVRRATAETLGSFGSASQPAISALRNHLFDDDADVRRAVSDALLNIK